MRVATWYVHSLYRVGAVNEFVKEMGKYKVDIFALQKLLQGKGTVIKKNCVILSSVHKSEKHEF